MKDPSPEHEPPDDEPQRPVGGPRSAGDSGPGRTEEVLTSAFDGLTPRQGKAVESLLREPTIARAALAAGVHERTLRKWLVKAPFRAAVLSARREAFGQAVGLR